MKSRQEFPDPIGFRPDADWGESDLNMLPTNANDEMGRRCWQEVLALSQDPTCLEVGTGWNSPGLHGSIEVRMFLP